MAVPVGHAPPPRLGEGAAPYDTYDTILARLGLVRACGHHWLWTSPTGVCAWMRARRHRHIDRSVGRCDAAEPRCPDGRCACATDHVVHERDLGRGTPRHVVEAAVLAAAGAEERHESHIPPAKIIEVWWNAFTRSVWLYGERDAWDLIAAHGPGGVEFAVRRWGELHGDARPVLSRAARHEAARLRRLGSAP